MALAQFVDVEQTDVGDSFRLAAVDQEFVNDADAVLAVVASKVFEILEALQVQADSL